MQYPHWLMVAGAVLVVLGSAGLVFRKSRAEPAEDDLEHDVAPPQLRSRPTGRLMIWSTGQVLRNETG
jgi:LPXTG-motif cell wall-anchored protein